jgi:alkylation response protein AidB-like acyl-CoA dehydrogenase
MASADTVQVVRSLTSWIRAQCADIDSARAVPSAVIDELRRAGVFRMLAPRDFDGSETDPAAFFDVVEETSYADGSVGWIVMIAGGYAALGGLLARQAAAEILGNPSTILVGAFKPAGTAVQVDGGYRVRGQWSLGSGSNHATWFVAGCVVVRNDEPLQASCGGPVMREVIVPASAVQVIDTWESTGLRGTASHDFRLDDVFVPASRTFWFQEPPVCDRSLYRMPPLAMFATFISAVSLGIARHAIDAFIAQARTKTVGIGTGVVAERSVAQATVGRAHALVSGGRVYVKAALEDLWSRVQVAHAPTLADRAALWTAATHAAHHALEAIQILYSAAGAEAVYARSPLDRCLRDARTAVQHVTVQQNNYEHAGRLLLSGEPAAMWMMDYRGEGREFQG